MNTKIDEFWWWRWESIYDQISETRNEADEPFASLLGELLDFGCRQFTYFFCGFGAEIPGDINKSCGAPPSLAIDYECPPNYVLRVILNRIADDFSLIKQAWLQHHGIPSEIETLELARKWGETLLNPIVNNNGGISLQSKPAIIPYLHFAPHIRMIPYGNVALVGTPITATLKDHRRDLLMMGHELAHYIYWNGRFKGESVKEKLNELIQSELPYIKNWIEEIFADVFGIYAGQSPSVWIAAMSMIQDNPPIQYINNDEKHPIDAVRVYIYLDFIQLITDKIMEVNKDIHSSLDDLFGHIEGSDSKWMRYFQERIGMYSENDNVLKTIDKSGNLITLKLTNIRKTLKRVASKILEDILIPGYVNFTSWEKAVADRVTDMIAISGSLRKNFDFDNNLFDSSKLLSVSDENQLLFERFENKMRELENEDLPGLEQRDDSQIIPIGHKQQENSYKRNFIELREYPFTEKVESNIWKVVFEADGWAFKGPEAGPPDDTWEHQE